MQNNSLVVAGTNAVGIEFGQTSILAKDGVMGAATGPDSGGSFSILNQFTSAIGLSVSALVDGAFLPIYTSPEVLFNTSNTFTPITDVTVWFAIHQNTSTMFFESETQAIEVVYAGTTNQTVSYSSGTWASGPLSTTTSPPASSTAPPVTTSASHPATTTSSPVTHSTSSGEAFFYLYNEYIKLINCPLVVG